MWEPTNRNQAKKCREVQRRVGKFLGSSSIVRLGGNVTTKIQSNASYPTQRKYPGKGTTIGSSSIITERSTVTADCKVKSRTQREYPHGRKLGYSNVKIGDGGVGVQSVSTDSVLSQSSQASSKRSSPLYGRENRNPLIQSQPISVRRQKSLAANSESMKEPLKPSPVARSYPHHGTNQFVRSNVPITFNEKAPRDPKPQPRAYPGGVTQFKSSLDLSGEKSAPPHPSHGVARRYSRLGMESKETTPKQRTTPVLPNKSGSRVDPNSVLQRCISSRRQQQQFNHSNVQLGTVKESEPKAVKARRSMGFSTIASVISTATAKMIPKRSSRQSLSNRSHSQTLGFSRIQLG